MTKMIVKMSLFIKFLNPSTVRKLLSMFKKDYKNQNEILGLQ